MENLTQLVGQLTGQLGSAVKCGWGVLEHGNAPAVLVLDSHQRLDCIDRRIDVRLAGRDHSSHSAEKGDVGPKKAHVFHDADVGGCDMEAFRVLSNPIRRAEYDARYEERREARWRIFDQTSATNDVAADRRLRDAVLSLLYAARRNDPDQPGVGMPGAGTGGCFVRCGHRPTTV